MVALFSLLVILILSILITRIAAVALTHTGLSRQVAQFQARSAFTGVGFTTGEAESVVNHPVRRKIIAYLMILGNVGIISAVGSLILTFVEKEGEILQWYYKLLILIAGILLLWALANSTIMDRMLRRVITYSLKKYTQLKVQDYMELLNLSGDYEITELLVEKADWLEGKSLAELKLRDEGVNVLGIRRTNGSYIGVPRGETEIESGDRLIIYGREKGLKQLDERKTGYGGDKEHEEAVDEQESVKEKEVQADLIRNRDRKTNKAH